MTEFYLTGKGAKFYEYDVPRISDALEKIAKQLEQMTNKLEKPVNNSDKKGLQDWNTRIIQETIAYLKANRQDWHDRYLKHGAVPYSDAKSVLSTLIMLLEKFKHE